MRLWKLESRSRPCWRKDLGGAGGLGVDPSTDRTESRSVRLESPLQATGSVNVDTLIGGGTDDHLVALGQDEGTWSQG